MTKPGPSGEFHYVLLLNPGASMEYMRTRGWMQDGIYSRFIDRMIEVGAFGDIEAVRAHWAAEAAKAAAAAAVPPPPLASLPQEVVPAAAV